MIVAALKVSIRVTYTSPDQYPHYNLPNFRASSSVTLRCIAEGASGSVEYRWSSTCSACFASNSNSASISEQFLRSRDNGEHTCTVRDAAGNSGSYTQQMNIKGLTIMAWHIVLLMFIIIYLCQTGAGIHVEQASSYGGTQANQPSNTYIVHYRPSGQSTYFSLYCCSGSSNGIAGNFVDPNGHRRSSNYDTIYRITSYGSSSSYAGCVRFEASRKCIRQDRWSCREYSSNPTNGLYKCNIPDESGVLQTVGFALLSSKLIV